MCCREPDRTEIAHHGLARVNASRIGRSRRAKSSVSAKVAGHKDEVTAGYAAAASGIRSRFQRSGLAATSSMSWQYDVRALKFQNCFLAIR
jgi:hypothetical protein